MKKANPSLDLIGLLWWSKCSSKASIGFLKKRGEGSWKEALSLVAPLPIQCTLFAHAKNQKSVTANSTPLWRVIYWGVMEPLCIMAAFCSWKRSCRRAELFRCLSTQRITQVSSRLIKDLVVKSVTQSSKQRWTILEYIYHEREKKESATSNSGETVVSGIRKGKDCCHIGDRETRVH